MKQLTAIIWIIFLFQCLASGQNTQNKRGILVETELATLAAKGTGVHFTYSFTDKWSVCGGGCIWLDKCMKLSSHIEDSHNESLNIQTKNETNIINDFYRSEIAVRFWPIKPLIGQYVSIGVRYGNNSRTDCILEYGYRLPLAMNLGLTISLKTGLRSLLTHTFSDQQTLNIRIGYDF